MSEQHGYTLYHVRRQRRLWRTAAIAVVLVIGGLAGGGTWLARADSGQLPPNVEIAGVEVGGLTIVEARARLEQMAARVAAQPITLVAEGVRLSTSGAELGAEADTEAALEQARESRSGLSRLKARLGIADPVEIPLSFTVSPASLVSVLERIAGEVERESVSAGVELVGRAVIVTPAQSGIELDVDSATRALASLPSTVELETREVPPPVGNEAAEAAKATADSLISVPPAIVQKKTTLTFEPELIRTALRFTPVGSTIAVSLDPKVLDPVLRQAFRKHERSPRDATFRVTGKRVRVVLSKAGRELAVAAIAASVVENAGAARILALFEPVEADFTTAEAKALGIHELVSEFTTPYPCCAPRVSNIQLAAKILDGSIIKPGGRFSLNTAMGPRTTERGFLPAPMIEAGRLVDAVGGGVSQVATTFYNAAFFAGLDLIAHTPHSFYISRYPMGREATVSWGGPELIFRNDWPAAILVKVSASDTSITVRFYSSKLGRRVETETGAPYDYRAARTITEVNSALPPGSRNVVQNGGVSGFSVDYTRKVFRGDELRRDERFHVRYSPEDTIIEVGPPKKGSGGKGAEAPGGEQPGAGQEGGGSAPPAEEPPGSSEPPVPPSN